MQPVEPSTMVRGPAALTMSFMTRADSQPWQVRCPEVKYSSRVTFLTPLKGWRIWVVLVKVSAIFTLLIRSPRTAGPQPRDVLRLAKPSFARLGRRGPSPPRCCGSPRAREVLRLAKPLLPDTQPVSLGVGLPGLGGSV